MNFIVANWLWFGLAAVIIFISTAANFLAATRSSLRGDVESFKKRAITQIVLAVLWICALIPFLIGAVVAIIEYTKSH